MGTPAAGTGTTAVKPWFVRDGFVAPEAVRYDPDQDVYFVGNWGTGSASATDNNGYISRMKPDGQIENLRFIAGGTNSVVLHAPRGMYIVGDTLWVADADAVRGFNRRTGEKLANIDFSAFDRGFLNDVAADATGTVYVTDTGRNKVYKVQGERAARRSSSATPRSARRTGSRGTRRTTASSSCPTAASRESALDARARRR